MAPDQRGYGDTDAPLDVTSFDIFNLTGDLVGLVNGLGETQAILIGHDWGSMVAAHAALVRPDMFRAVVLMSVPYLPRGPVRPAATFHVSTQERHFYQDYFQKPGHVERELEIDIRRSILSILYTGSGECRVHPTDRKAGFVSFSRELRFIDALATPEKLPEWLTEHDLNTYVRQFEASGFRGGINWYRNIDRNWAMTAFLDGARILQPALFISGALDGVLKMTQKEFGSLESNVPRLRGKLLIDGAGHWVQQERPEEVNRLLLDFLRTLQ